MKVHAKRNGPYAHVNEDDGPLCGYPYKPNTKLTEVRDYAEDGCTCKRCLKELRHLVYVEDLRSSAAQVWFMWTHADQAMLDRYIHELFDHINEMDPGGPAPHEPYEEWTKRVPARPRVEFDIVELHQTRKENERLREMLTRALVDGDLPLTLSHRILKEVDRNKHWENHRWSAAGDTERALASYDATRGAGEVIEGVVG